MEDIDKYPPGYLYDKVKIILNGCWLGVCDNPYELYKFIKDKKKQGIINIYTSVVFNTTLLELKICTDAGRLCRPLFIVENSKLITNNPAILKQVLDPTTSWDELTINHTLDKAVIEYVDSEEQNYSMIAITQDKLKNKLTKWTHCEIHPSTNFWNFS